MATVKIAADVLLQEEAGDAFLLHVESGEFFGLNRSGLVVWKALEAGGDPLEAVAERWPGIPPEQRKHDVDTLLAALLAAGLAHDGR